MEDLNLEKEYQLYLKRVGLKEHLMNPIQKIETKRAFMAGCSQMMVLFRDVIGNIHNEKVAVNLMKSLFQQAENFWLKESSKLN